MFAFPRDDSQVLEKDIPGSEKNDRRLIELLKKIRTPFKETEKELTMTAFLKLMLEDKGKGEDSSSLVFNW